MHLGSDADQKYTQQAQAIVDMRDKVLWAESSVHSIS